MNKPVAKTRDIRLLIALLLFVLSLIAGLIQAWILRLYIEASVSGHWEYFSETFSVRAPASGPNDFCFDHCAADLPFLAGWIGVICFGLGLVVLVYCWLKPRAI